MRESKYKEAFKRQRFSKCKCAWLLITTVCSLRGKTRGKNVSKQVTYQYRWTLVATTFEFRHADSMLLLRRRPQTVNSKDWNCKSVTFIPSGQHTFVSLFSPFILFSSILSLLPSCLPPLLLPAFSLSCLVPSCLSVCPSLSKDLQHWQMNPADRCVRGTD